MSYKYYYNILYIHYKTASCLSCIRGLLMIRLARFVREFVLLRQCMVLSCSSNRAVIFLFMVCGVASRGGDIGGAGGA